MLKKLMITLLLSTLPLSAQPPVPKPCSAGDYWTRSEHTWLHWEVVSTELNGRLTPAWPLDEEDPEALLGIDWVVPQWPVVAKFGKGDLLYAVTDENGGDLIKDIDGGTWMKVRAPQGGFCFIRASAKFVRPVAPEAVANQVQQDAATEPAEEILDAPEPELVMPVLEEISE